MVQASYILTAHVNTLIHNALHAKQGMQLISIYLSSKCRTIDQVTRLYAYFAQRVGRKNWPEGNKRVGNALVEMFHGHMDETGASKIPTVFAGEESTVRCVIATIAFGMGINIPDITYVLHWGPASTLVAYWQQVGRCARDGKPGKAVLYVYPHCVDSRTTSEDMSAYIKASSSRCLRQQVLQALKIQGQSEDEIDYCCFGSRCCSFCDVDQH